ncbi:MAG: metallophosphoesterase [Bacteroidales bacterium]
MNLFQTADRQIKDEEPFFNSGRALHNWLLDFFSKQKEPFVYLDSGDVFNSSKETGRVNGEIIKFFLSVCSLPLCKKVYVIQGNHDYRSDTGSALSILEGQHENLILVDKPSLVKLPEQKGISVFLPHIGVDTSINFYGRQTYGKESFFTKYFEKQDWQTVKEQVEFVSAHLGDKTSGEFFMDADISFIPGIHSHGHIHKTVSKNHLESSLITRRDEVDKRCVMRKFRTEDFSSFEEIDLPLFLNFTKIAYGAGLLDSFVGREDKIPTDSLIVDITGHDNEEVVKKEYDEKIRKFNSEEKSSLVVFLGKIIPEDKRQKTNSDSAKEDLDIDETDLKSLLIDFCEEKKIKDSIKESLLKRLQNE